MVGAPRKRATEGGRPIFWDGPFRNRGDRPTGQRLRRRTPRAFTLLELLLVLALLVVLAALAMPLFEGSFASLRLRRATDQIVAVWIRTRAAAIDSGRPHRFLFRAGSGDYLVEPWPRSEDDSATSPDGRGAFREFPEEFHGEDGTLLIRDRLPEGIVIAEGERVDHDSSQGESSRVVASLTDISRAAGSPETGAQGKGPHGTAWSSPILFYPDGTALDASLLLGNTRRQYQRATLRGLTGTGRASRLIPAGRLAAQGT